MPTSWICDDYADCYNGGDEAGCDGLMSASHDETYLIEKFMIGYKMSKQAAQHKVDEILGNNVFHAGENKSNFAEELNKFRMAKTKGTDFCLYCRSHNLGHLL